MGGRDQTLLFAAVCLVIAVVMLSVRDITETLSGPVVEGHRQEALPFFCAGARGGAGPQDGAARLTLTFDANRDGDFPHFVPLTRGTTLRAASGGEVLCFAHRAATPHDLWEDAAGGSLRILGRGGAISMKRERPLGADAFAPATDVDCRGSCERVL